MSAYSLTMKRRFVCVLVCLVAFGCGDDVREPEPDPVVPMCIGCVDGLGFDEVNLTGIWHFQVAFDETATFPAALRLQALEQGYDGHLLGRVATSVTVNASDLLIDVSDPDGDGMSGRRILTINKIAEDGRVTGSYESCNPEECFTATVEGFEVRALDEPIARGLTLVSQYGGPGTGEWQQAERSLTVNVRVADSMAYLARYGDGLRIIDLADPANPIERGHYPVENPGIEIYNDVKLASGPDGTQYALMASNVIGVVVFDVSDPDAPTWVASFPPSSEAPQGRPAVHTLFVEGDRAYVAFNFDQSLRIYDIADPSQPVALGSYRNPRMGTEGGYLHDLFVDNGRVYLNYWNLGMTIVDTLDDPANPVLVGEYDDYGENTSHSNWIVRAGGRTVSVHGDEQYGAHVRIVDVEEESPEFLQTIASYQTRQQISVHNIMAHGDRAFVTYYQDGLRILDLSDPAAPVEIGHFHTWPGFGPEQGFSFYEGAIGVDFEPATDTIYLADTIRGLFVLTID